MKKDYIPVREGDLITWLKNYHDKLPNYKAVLGLNDDEVKKQQDFCNLLIAALEANEAAQATAEKARTDADKQKKTSIQGIRKKAQQMKVNDGYNDGIGKDLQIIGEEDSTDTATAQPKLKSKKVETGLQLSFNLLGFFDGVKIFRKRPNEDKKFLAVDTSSPYIDTDPPETRHYKLRYLFGNDEIVGLESDVIKVVAEIY